MTGCMWQCVAAALHDMPRELQCLQMGLMVASLPHRQRLMYDWSGGLWPLEAVLSHRVFGREKMGLGASHFL